MSSTFSLSQPLDVVILMAVLGIIPMVCVLATSFTKIAIVFALVKNAIGIQQVPSNLVTNALALVITMFIMAPIALQVTEKLKSDPPTAEQRNEWLITEVTGALTGFMIKHVDPQVQERLLATAKKVWPPHVAEKAQATDLFILVPAFAISEISAAFKIGFVLYIAFVAVDLIVANILMAMGMIMFSPTVVSIPLKVILFVAADGWARLVESLILSYQ